MPWRSPHGVLKVLVVTNMYPTPSEPWFGTFVAEQVQALQSLGVEVTVFSFDGRSSRREYFKAAAQLRRQLAIEMPDIIHAHYGLAGAVALTQRSRPVITTFHGSETGYIWWQTVVSRLVARMSTPVLVDSRAGERLGTPAAVVIPCGVNLNVFRPVDRTAARAALGWSDDGVYALFPGARTNHRKRFDLFESALEVYRNSYGPIHPVWLERLDRPGVATVTAASDVMLMTSDFEGSPVAVKEALACETPVVSVDVGDVTEILGGLQSCSVALRDPKGLADALNAAVSESDRSDLRVRADRYSNHRVAERLVALYEDHLARHPSATRNRQPEGVASGSRSAGGGAG